MQEFILRLIEESDRGCVLVAAAKIENILEEIFRNIFTLNAIPKRVAVRIFEVGGPLSTFSAKAKMAYAMGLISRDVYMDIERIRDLRNAFAHSIDFADFLDPKVADMVYSLNCVKPLNIRPSIPSSESRLSLHQQAKITADGYVTVNKTAFSFGIRNLLLDLLTAFPESAEKAETV
jgi:DNA-binding MltR family transcriptional regulator